jgi:subtilase family serine protease/subtilisin family serine protease
MRTAPNGRIILRECIACAVAILFASILLLSTGLATAGSVHPNLEARLASLPPDADLPVIVELTTRADPAVAGRAPGLQRRARTHAVVNALRDTAQRTQASIKAHLAREQADGVVRKVRPFWVFNGFSITATQRAIRRLAARDDVREVRLDATIPPPVPRPAAAAPASADSAWNIEMIRAPEAWALGYAGAGIVVGSFDTGVDGSHPELAPRYRGNDAISWFDPYGEHSSPYDNNGHGTHTVGSMVGGDQSGYNIGVAPDARWIAAKAWDDADDATESAFHQIFEWFLAPGGDPANAPDVVNSSWGLDPALCFLDFRADVQALRAAGIVPIFAAGNSGPGAASILAPGSYPESFAVGSTDFYDDISFFSSEGPSPCDGATKPNISAPGEFILSTFPGGDYIFLDGTSMATPQVSGAAAVLLSIDPTLTVDEVQAALAVGAVDLGPPGQDNAFGYGRLDVMESALRVLGVDRIGVVATTRTAYEAGTVPGVFTVSRSGSTTDARMVTYTVSGTATPGSDYVALSGSVVIPAGAASATIVVTPIDDSDFEHDETVILTLAATEGFVMSPPAATVTIVSDDAGPDLVVTSLALPTDAGAGLPITITDTTRNQGAGAAAASTTTYYLSTNNGVLDAADVVLGSRAVPALAPGVSNSGSLTVTIPPGTPTGAHYVFAKADGDDLVSETVETNNTNYRALSVGPDLLISNLNAPATAGAGATITVTDTTRNQGAGAAAATNTRYYLSSNYLLDAADVLLGSRAVAALAPGASDTGSAALTIPASTTSGIYYLLAKADGGDAQAEVLESNNVSWVYITIGVDLVVSDLTLPTDAGAGFAITITDTTRNQGAGTAAASTTTYYLSTNNGILDAADVVLGSRAVPALGPGVSHSGAVSVTIPPGTPTGTHYVYAKADADAMVGETNETNNTNYRFLRVGPDLLIASFTAPAATGAGATITVTDTTRNQGAGAASATNTRYYLSPNNALDASDVLLGSRAIAALAPGVSDTGSVAITIPAGTASGSYFLLAKADADDAVVETQEGNNVSTSFITIGVDLVVTDLTVPADAGAGLAITIGDTTRNQGAGTAPASTTTYYLSTNNGVLDAADVVLGSRAVPALGPGVSHSGTVSVTVPPGTPSGTHYVYAKADADGLVSETNETNNTNYRFLRVGPDLLIASLSVPASAGAGATITVADTTRNQGAGAAVATNTRFYLSLNNALDASDVLLGARAVAALAPGASDSGSVALTIPAGTASGSYYLLAKADGDDTQAEVLESNNVSTAFITIGVDLVVTDLTVPADAGAGFAITISDTTRNQGTGTAPASTTTYYLSTNNGILDAADVVLGSRAVPALGSGVSHSGAVSVTIPPGTPTGTFYVYVKADADSLVSETNETNNTTYRFLRVGPDLLIASLAAPAAAGAGTTITVTDTTRNQGAGAASATSTRYYLSINNALDASDVLLGARGVAALAPGASDAGSVAITIPAGTASGSYYILAKADGDDAVVETQEGNNVSTSFITIGVDLVVTDLIVPADAGAGFAITITDTTRNQGAGTAPASTTTYYLSTNNGVLDAADVVLGSRAVPALGPGVSHTGAVSVTVPPGTPPGTHYVYAKADADAAVSETNETNNLNYRFLRVGPDLLITTLNAPATAGAGDTITVTDTTRNQGAGAAVATNTRYYLSLNYLLDGADVLLGARAVAALAPGASDAGSVAITIPAGTASGSYYLLAKADGDDAQAEVLESNNVSWMYITIGSDLAITDLTVPTSARVGFAITISDTTRNQGAGTAAASTTTYYLSTNNGVLDAADLALGSRAVPALGSGVSNSGSLTVTIPPGTPIGTFYVYVKADADGSVSETNETNNTTYRFLRIDP